MSWLRFNLTLLLVVVATVATALVQGRIVHRWGTSDAVRKAADRLQEFPQDFGDWHTTSASELEAESQNQLQCVGALVRVYKNMKTGDEVTLLFLLGPTGPTAVHSPEVCMLQSEFTALGDRRTVAVGPGGDSFWNKRFKVNDVHSQPLSAYWAWNRGGKWVAPQDARFAFVGLPFLYKAQVTCGFHGPADSDPNDCGRRFLADFVPVAANYMVPDIKD